MVKIESKIAIVENVAIELKSGHLRPEDNNNE